jgi:hypothetical protein
VLGCINERLRVAVLLRADPKKRQRFPESYRGTAAARVKFDCGLSRTSTPSASSL